MADAKTEKQKVKEITDKLEESVSLNSNYLEIFSQTKYVVFDKTGSMTKGVFEVNGIHHSTIGNEKLLEYAAFAESASSHPISKSLQWAYGREIDRTRVSDIQEISGNGVTAKVDGMEVAAGNDKLMKHLIFLIRTVARPEQLST